MVTAVRGLRVVVLVFVLLHILYGQQPMLCGQPFALCVPLPHTREEVTDPLERLTHIEARLTLWMNEFQSRMPYSGSADYLKDDALFQRNDRERFVDILRDVRKLHTDSGGVTVSVEDNRVWVFKGSKHVVITRPILTDTPNYWARVYEGKPNPYVEVTDPIKRLRAVELVAVNIRATMLKHYHGYYGNSQKEERYRLLEKETGKALDTFRHREGIDIQPQRRRVYVSKMP